MKRPTKRLILPFLLGVFLAFPAAAGATTICLPDNLFAACPAGSVDGTSLESAMSTNSSDGIPDLVVIDSGQTVDAPDGALATGTDPLEIAGAGRGTGAAATRITSINSGQGFVVSTAGRPANIHDLTIVMPTSFQDGFGTGLITSNATLNNVDFESRNGGTGSDGVVLQGNSTYTNGAIYAVGAGAKVDDGISSDGPPAGGVVASGLTISNANRGVNLFDGSVPLTLRRSLIINPASAGVFVGDNGIGTIQNTVIRTNGAGSALEASQNTAGATAILSARNVTAVRTGATDNASAVVSAVPAGNGSTNVVVDDSILNNYASSWNRNGGGAGTANLTIRFSDLTKNGSSTGTGSLSVPVANTIDVPPMFAGATDFHILPGSLVIDQADPASAITEDFDGALRPVDGNNDGVARNDMGAFELQLPVIPTPPGDSSSAPQVTAAPLPLAPTATKKKCKKKKR